MITLLVVAAGAALGACLRYGLSSVLRSHGSTAFPSATLLINALGSFGVGVLALGGPIAATGGMLRLVLVTGVLGSFTTFSTFSYETYDLLTQGGWLLAALNVLGSVAAALVACAVGCVLAQLLVWAR